MRYRHIYALIPVWVLYTAVVLTTLGNKTLDTFPDSSRYLPPVDIFASAQPGILTSVIYSVLGGSSVTILFFQSVLAILAWSSLSLAVLLLVQGRLGYSLAILVLLYSLTIPVLSWQWIATSDGVVLSLTTTWIASLILLVKPSELLIPWLLCVNLVLTTLALLSRPQLVIIVVPLQVLAFFMIRNRLSKKWKMTFATGLVFPTLWAGWRLLGVVRDPDLSMVYASNNMVGKANYRNWALNQFPDCSAIQGQCGICQGV